jgi:two-component system copper resistance phosphate regulon response regulator CusR
MRVLIIEDEKKLSAFIAKGLAQEGFSVDTAASAAEAEKQTLNGVYDLIVMDVNLPDGDGFTLLEELRRQGDATPVIMLTARGSVDDKVRGLETGANDYLTKPFSFRELVARARVLMRTAEKNTDVLAAGDLTLDVRARKAVRAGKTIELTNKEFALLEILLRNAGRPVSRAVLWEHAWEGSFEVDSNVLDVHVGRLRRKIDAGAGDKLVRTVYGVGYKIDVPGRA